MHPEPPPEILTPTELAYMYAKGRMETVRKHTQTVVLG